MYRTSEFCQRRPKTRVFGVTLASKNVGYSCTPCFWRTLFNNSFGIFLHWYNCSWHIMIAFSDFVVCVLDTVSKEAIGMSCSFRDNCGCGYQYMSSNINLVWKRQLHGSVNALQHNDTAALGLGRAFVSLAAAAFLRFTTTTTTTKEKHKTTINKHTNKSCKCNSYTIGLLLHSLTM